MKPLFMGALFQGCSVWNSRNSELPHSLVGLHQDAATCLVALLSHYDPFIVYMGYNLWRRLVYVMECDFVSACDSPAKPVLATNFRPPLTGHMNQSVQQAGIVGRLRFIHSTLLEGANDDPPKQYFTEFLAKAVQCNQVDVVAAVIQVFDKGATQFDRKLLDQMLLLAVSAGLPAMAELLLKAGAPVDTIGDGGQTSLQLACANGDVRCVRLLLANNATATTPDGRGRTSLHYVVARRGPSDAPPAAGKWKLSVFPKADPRHVDHALCAKLILSHLPKTVNVSETVNSTDIFQVAPLHLVDQNTTVELAETLLENGADLAATTRVMNTPLLNAIFSETPLAVVQKICHQLPPAEIRRTNRFGDSPLSAAVAKCRPDLVQFLLDKGGAVEMVPERGTLFHHLAWEAPRHPNRSATDYSRSVKKVAQLLVSAGVDVTAPRVVDGSTALHFAILQGSSVVTEALLEHGASWDQPREDGNTPRTLVRGR